MLKLRSVLHNALINQFENLTFEISGEALFNRVIKYPAEVMQDYECSIQFTNTSIFERDLTYSKYGFGFRAVVQENMNDGSTDEELDIKTDRLADVEARLLFFFDVIPNLLNETLAEGISVYDIDSVSINYFVQETNMGYSLVQVADFRLKVELASQTLI